MAAKKGAKNKDAGGTPKAGSKSGPGPMLVALQMFCAVVAVVTLLVMLVALFDVGSYGLGTQLRGFALVPIAIFTLTAIGALVPAFMPRSTDDEAIEARIQEFEARMVAQMGETRTKVETHIGSDYQDLKAENETLREQLNAIDEAQQASIKDEVERLRAVNSELEAQIKQWAIGSVSQAVTDLPDQGPESINVA